LTRTAESTYTSLTSDQQHLARHLFQRLIALGDGTEDTKRRVRHDELDHDDPNSAIVVNALTQARLITLDDGCIQLTHEALIRQWPRLRDWLAEDREGQRTHRDLTDAAHAWDGLNRDSGALYRGARLVRARDWAAARAPVLTSKEREFLDMSLAAESQERRTSQLRTRRLRQLVALLTILLLAASAITGYAIHSRNVAAEQRALATQQRNLTHAISAAREATLLRDRDQVLALQVALAAYQLDPNQQTRGTLMSAYGNSLINDLWVPGANGGRTIFTVMPGFIGHNELLGFSDKRSIGDSVDAAISSDGRVVAALGPDSTVRLFTIDKQGQMTPAGSFSAGSAAIGVSLSFSIDGQVLMVESWNQTVLWDVSNPSMPTTMMQVPGGMPMLSADRHMLGTVVLGPESNRDPAEIALWDITNPLRPEKAATITGNPGRYQIGDDQPRWRFFGND
jgi:hypothetical protein